jgi:hypothetical protein
MTEHGQMLYMTGFHCPTTKTLCLASFFVCVGPVRFFRVYCMSNPVTQYGFVTLHIMLTTVKARVLNKPYIHY